MSGFRPLGSILEFFFFDFFSIFFFFLSIPCVLDHVGVCQGRAECPGVAGSVEVECPVPEGGQTGSCCSYPPSFDPFIFLSFLPFLQGWEGSMMCS